MSFETHKHFIETQYPGFPEFIHRIMANYERGMSKEEMIADVQSANIATTIDKTIKEVEKTHMTYKKAVMAASRIEANNKTLSNMIFLSMNDNKENECNGISRGDESVS